MTNQKIKDYHKNRELYEVLCDVMKMHCIVLLCLNKHYPKLFYQLNVQKWLEEHEEWCDVMAEYENDDAYEYKMQEFCNRCKIDNDRTMSVVARHLSSHNPSCMNVLKENLKLDLIHTAVDFGFGKKRLDDLIGYLLTESYPDWKDDIARLGINIEAELCEVDYRQLKPKKKRFPTIQEQKEAQKMLAGYRAYFDYIVSSEQ